MRRSLTIASLSLAALFAGIGCGSAQQPKFPFVIPWDDATHTAVDVSSLNSAPAGANGFIVVKNGHFAESKTGKRIRFIGVNIAIADAFPSHEDAEKIAARLAKYGCNLVRMHHMDNTWGIQNHTSIWDPKFTDHRHIDPSQLDKVDYFISQFKKHGIYVDINLHVSRKFSAEDGFPESVNTIGFDFDKRVDYFDTRMIELQKEYAKQLLTHVNPYTKTAYVNEPAVLNVEMTNEDSLTGDTWGMGTGLTKMPEPFNGELQGLWNTWLKGHYGSTKALLAARKVTPISGPNIARSASDPSHWTLETQGDSKAVMTADGDAIKVEVTKPDDTDWHIQLHQTGLDLKEGQSYTLQFRAKAAAACDIPVGTRLDQADWHNVGLDTSAHLTTDWQDFTYSFQAGDVVANHCRISFVLGKQPVTMWVSDISLRSGDARADTAGQTLEAGTIALPVNPSKYERADWLAFLVDTEKSYVLNMKAYLTSTLKLHSLLECSPTQWGGLSGVYRESLLDINDTHNYWQHPAFPGKPWDPVDWRIGNTSMVPVLGKGDTLSNLAAYRNIDKPFTVTEYNHPAPSEYQSEMMPLFAGMAAAQDWDAIYLFDYGSDTEGKISGFFACGSNPAKWAFMPASAMIFRAGGVPKAEAATVAALPKTLTGSFFLAHISAEDAFRASKLPPGAAYTRRLALKIGAPADVSTNGPSSLSYQNSDPKTAQFTANAPGVKSVVGFVGGRTVAVGDTNFTFGDMPNGFASLTLTSMDAKPLATSARSLLTVVDRVENTDMQWNAAHNSVNDHWGSAPTLADFVPVTVSLPCDGKRTVSALDGTGAVQGSVSSEYKDGILTFSTSEANKTVWYLIEKAGK